MEGLGPEKFVYFEIQCCSDISLFFNFAGQVRILATVMGTV